jgi:hypothetical protein
MIQLGGSSMPPFSSQDFVLEVRPISLGDSVIARPVEPLDASWAGLLWTAWVGEENKVTIRLANITNSTVTPALRSFTAN